MSDHYTIGDVEGLSIDKLVARLVVAVEKIADPQPQIKLSRLEMAMVLMFRTTNPSLRQIAMGMNLKSHASLYKIKGFKEIFERYKQFLEFSGASMRSVIHERESDWTGEDDL